MSIEWSCRADRFRFGWRESNGPPVTPPIRKGFGSTVIINLAKMSVYGDVELDYAPQGFFWSITCPSDKALDMGGGGNGEQTSDQAGL